VIACRTSVPNRRHTGEPPDPRVAADELRAVPSRGRHDEPIRRVSGKRRRESRRFDRDLGRERQQLDSRQGERLF
jgi:hypothetical protein